MVELNLAPGRQQIVKSFNGRVMAVNYVLILSRTGQIAYKI